MLDGSFAFNKYKPTAVARPSVHPSHARGYAQRQSSFNRFIGYLNLFFPVMVPSGILSFSAVLYACQIAQNWMRMQ